MKTFVSIHNLATITMRGHEYNLLSALGSYMQVFFDVSAQSLLGSPFEDACLL